MSAALAREIILATAALYRARQITRSIASSINPSSASRSSTSNHARRSISPVLQFAAKVNPQLKVRMEGARIEDVHRIGNPALARAQLPHARFITCQPSDRYRSLPAGPRCRNIFYPSRTIFAEAQEAIRAPSPEGFDRSQIGHAPLPITGRRHPAPGPRQAPTRSAGPR